MFVGLGDVTEVPKHPKPFRIHTVILTAAPVVASKPENLKDLIHPSNPMATPMATLIVTLAVATPVVALIKASS